MLNETDGVEGLIPNVKCKKCGKNQWEYTDEPYSWSCPYCGNLIYFTYGELRQQIDVLMASQERRAEYVKSVDGASIKPKRNETLKKLRFENRLEATV